MKRWTRKQTVTRVLLGLAGLAALLLTLPHGSATSTLADAPLRAERGPAAQTAAPPEQPRASPALPDSNPYLEWHSDGGYWYYRERQGRE